MRTYEAEGASASGMVYRAGTQSADDPHEYIMNSGTEDRMKDIIEVEGFNLKAFKRNPIALFNHNSDAPIGVWENVRVEGKALVGRLKLAAEGTSELIDSLRKLVDQRILRAVSVGFRPTEMEEIKNKDGSWTGGYRFLKADLMETSLVSIPADPAALSLAKSLGIHGAELKTVFSNLERKKAADKSVEPEAFVPTEEILKRHLASRPTLKALYKL